MRLNCEILVVNRVAGSLNMRTLSKPTRASVAIGRKESSKTHLGGKELTVFLLICTAREKNGTKYKIKENLLQVFTKFLENGKATIRLKEPPHDILISKADPSNLKALLSILKLGDNDLRKANLSCLVPAKSSDLEKPKTDMVITRRGDYPLGKSFSSGLQRLAVRNCGLLRIDLRILQLKSLTSLSLPGNQIQELPLRLSKLSTLSELVLSGNRIKEFPPTLCYGSLASCLKLLDLSQNAIKLLPVGFCSFRNLVHLKLDGNGLHMLPVNIGSLSCLRFFSASCNKLNVLPYSMLGLRLESVDVSENPFLLPDNFSTVNNLTVPSLMECAGIAVKKYRCQYSKGCIPASLSVFMDTIKQCPCGNYCFNSCVHYLVRMNLHQVAHTVVSKCQTLNYIPAEGYLCSWNCLRKFQNNKSHHWK